MITARRALGLVLAGALVLAACGGDDNDSGSGGGGGESSAEGTTRHVPEDFATVQAAVDAADPGDLILIGPGTYSVEVVVEPDELTLSGLVRDAGVHGCG